MQKEFQFLKVVDRTESQVLCLMCDGKFYVADGGKTSINQHIETQKHDIGTIVQECRYEPPSTYKASMTQDSDVKD